MPAKRFWLPIKHKLLYANIILYIFLIVLATCLYDDWNWAQRALRGYLLTGKLDPPASNQLLLKALNLPEGHENKRLQLFNEAYQIDPYSLASLMLGDSYLKQGNEESAITYYERFHDFDPSFIDVYKKMAKIMIKKQDQKLLDELLNEGITFFRRRVELYQPFYDPSVPDEYNAKAFKIHRLSKEALKQLEDMKHEMNKESQVVPGK